MRISQPCMMLSDTVNDTWTWWLFNSTLKGLRHTFRSVSIVCPLRKYRGSDFPTVELHAKPRCDFPSPQEANVLFTSSLARIESEREAEVRHWHICVCVSRLGAVLPFTHSHTHIHTVHLCAALSLPHITHTQLSWAVWGSVTCPRTLRHTEWGDWHSGEWLTRSPLWQNNFYISLPPHLSNARHICI